MSSIFFWRDWSGPYKRFWFLLLGLFAVSFSLAWYYYFTEPSGVISWEKIQEQRVIETNVHSFNVGPFKLSVPAESYVIFEYHQGSDLHHNALASYIFFGNIDFFRSCTAHYDHRAKRILVLCSDEHLYTFWCQFKI